MLVAASLAQLIAKAVAKLLCMRATTTCLEELGCWGEDVCMRSTRPWLISLCFEPSS